MADLGGVEIIATLYPEARGGDRETIRTLCGVVNILTDTLARVTRERPEPETFTAWLTLEPNELQPEYASVSGQTSAAQRSSEEEAMETRELSDLEQFRIRLNSLTDKKGKKVNGIDVEVVADDEEVVSVTEEEPDKVWLVKAGDPGTTTVTLRGTNKSGKPFMSAFSVIVNPGDVDVVDVALDANEQQPEEAPAPAPAPTPAPAPADGGAGDTTGGATGGATPTTGADTGSGAAPTDGSGATPVPAPVDASPAPVDASPAPAAPGPVDAGTGTDTGGAGGNGDSGVQIDPSTGAPVTPSNPGA